MSEAKTWVRIAYCRDIPVREGRAVRIGNREVAIFNLGDRFLEWPERSELCRDLRHARREWDRNAGDERHSWAICC